MPKSRNDTKTNPTTLTSGKESTRGASTYEEVFTMFGPMRKQTVRDVLPVCRERFPGRLLHANSETIERLKGLDLDCILVNGMVPENQIWVLLLPTDIKPIRRTVTDRHDAR